MKKTSLIIYPKPLHREKYAPYGEVIARDVRREVSANHGNALKTANTAKLINNRGARAQARLSIFQSKPIKKFPFLAKRLERHLYSTQVFLPIQSQSKRFLIIVCLGKKNPNLATLKAFIVKTSQGVTYHPGVWHHPIIALDKLTTFACLVWENGSQEDCNEILLKTPFVIQ